MSTPSSAHVSSKVGVSVACPQYKAICPGRTGESFAVASTKQKFMKVNMIRNCIFMIDKITNE